MIKQELLAPAGDIQAGYAALYYGADAVYLGLSQFSARATAVNFTEERLDQFTAYAHHLNRKVYVALNTVIQENELPDVLKSLDICARCKVDGLIIQDLGVVHLIKQKYPCFELHASTQMAVHNKEGALFLQKIGFKRVVLARELSLTEIKEIASIPGLETEAFIHGALCYSYSGLCQFSAIEYGRSANRGKCVYPCRSCFSVNGKNEHIFSMKDLALQEDILRMPVTSLKIEGRKKSALYVAAVTDYYRHILDGKKADYQKEERIKQIFSRPWCKLHFNGKNKDVTDRNFVGHRGLPIGKVSKVSKGWIYFRTEHKISRYDGIQIDTSANEKPFGFSMQKLMVNMKSCLEAQSGENVCLELPPQYPKINKGDIVYLASSSEVKGAYPYEKPKPNAFGNKFDININIDIFNDKIIASCDEFSVFETGNFLPTQNTVQMNENIINVFNKTGNTKFNLNNIDINNPDNLFIPISLLNKIRRDLYDKIKINNPVTSLPEITPLASDNKKTQFTIKVDNIENLKFVDLHKFSEVVVAINPLFEAKSLNLLPKNKVRIALPAVCRAPRKFDKIITQLLDMGYKRWEIANYWALNMLPVEQVDISFDASVYMLNTQAITEAKEIGASQITLSVEDNKTNISNIIKNSPLKTSLIIYQDIPLFISANCIRDNECRSCNGKEKWFDLTCKGNKYKALSRNCQVMVFDNQPFCIAGDVTDLHPDNFRIDFINIPYTPEQVRDITDRLVSFKDVTHCINGNFFANNI